jgi:hypothetical protein
MGAQRAASDIERAPLPLADVEPYSASPPEVASFDSEPVREFRPREAEPNVPVLTGPGYAPAGPVGIEWPSDLKQIESDPDKAKIENQEAAQESSASRTKRVRPPQVPVNEEPLVQVETGEPDASSADQSAPDPPR